MKILVFSDSHSDLSLLESALEKHKNDTDLIIHLGDCIADSKIFRDICPHIANINLLGNCDYFHSDNNAKTEISFQLGTSGLRAFACHGHGYGVKRSTDILYSKAKIEKASIALYGHTHIANITERNGIILMNPGSCSFPRSTEPCSYGIIRITNGEILPSVIFDR